MENNRAEYKTECVDITLAFENSFWIFPFVWLVKIGLAEFYITYKEMTPNRSKYQKKNKKHETKTRLGLTHKMHLLTSGRPLI